MQCSQPLAGTRELHLVSGRDLVWADGRPPVRNRVLGRKGWASREARHCHAARNPSRDVGDGRKYRSPTSGRDVFTLGCNRAFLCGLDLATA